MPSSGKAQGRNGADDSCDSGLSISELEAKREASYIFKYIVLVQVIMYMESGAIPALLNTLKAPENFDLRKIEQGALGGVVYLMLSLTCPFAGLLFRKFEAKDVMSFALLFNLTATLAFAFTPSKQPGESWR